MKYVKMLTLAAVAASALMALIGAGTASATVLCSTTADPCPKLQDWPVGTILDFSLAKETTANLVNTSGESLDKCTGSTLKGEITKTGGVSSNETVTGHLSELTWTGCTFTTNTISKACFEIHKIAGTSNGTVTSDKCTGGAENTNVTINTVLFGSCIYTSAAGSSTGDLTEGKFVTGGETTAILHWNLLATKVSGSNFACPETAKWAITFQLTAPENTTMSVAASVVTP